ncbi:unnamed protein product [Nippostrongylus brasiliensis]|uniref:Palmitoyltransferase n=1 Tax=Nippostrongylus brasiliensis TaxID=27835 RepID=A0A0N4YEJ4_NIPBR|nr:unnamed protein product [Nippostrongylus brasiliensis]
MLCQRPSGLQLLSYFLTVLLFPIATLSSLSLAFPYGTAYLVIGYIFVYAQNIFLTLYDVSPDELIARKKQGAREHGDCSTELHYFVELSVWNFFEILQEKEKTKHCRQCNFCVEVFDHHCIWLNNCIGKKNYRLFVVLLLSIVILAGGASIFGLAQVVFWVSEPSLLQHHTEMILHMAVPTWAFLSASFISFASHLAITSTTAHLLLFHVKLWKRGITTYRFILDQRQKKSTSRETISGHNDSHFERVISDGRPSALIGDSLTPKIADVQQRPPQHMQIEDTARPYCSDKGRSMTFVFVKEPAKDYAPTGFASTSQIELDRASALGESK